MLLIEPRRGDGWITIARRMTGSTDSVSAIRAANPGLRQVQLGRQVAVPVELLRGDLRLAVVRRIFPLDVRIEEGWEHAVLDPFSDGVEETWEWLAVLFTGRASEVGSLMRANPAVGETGLVRGLSVVIPASRLLPVFREIEPAPTPTPRPTPVRRPTPFPAATPRAPDAGVSPLEFGRDAKGEFAQYRLRHGEALYSAVVVRFTGQLLAQQVNETAMEIANRSGIGDVTSIPIGYPIKIPIDLLEPRYLPSGDARRVVWEAQRNELAGFFELVTATDLSGVQVVLDAGHGGADSGAVQGGIWEATYAYDIMCRIKANLEKHTRATVWITTEDVRTGCTTPQRNRLEQSRGRAVLTRPPYEISDAILGVHLRYYLTNDIILNRIGPGVARSKTVFLSVHADSLHPSVRGAMVYVPSRYLRPSEPYTVGRGDIKRFAEFQAHPTIRLSSDFKVRVEASSRHLAGSIVSSLERNDIAVHPNEPVRDRVLRGRRGWVPAVLRYTAAGNAVLVEVCNLGNPEDRELILQAEWRESFARAVVEGLAAAYEE
ncbi:MAG: N-acetylmuramoyl-L-alanine amidase [Candidatus Aminicenantes bacterium]|nr:MAG: N-acetylmuramoyl-L-alanine amidase [Candidatus Aminicenantes bacterium]